MTVTPIATPAPELRAGRCTRSGLFPAKCACMKHATNLNKR